MDQGVNWFDTAELYGGGVSEASLSKALKAAGKKDGEVVVATKWWPLFRTARNIPRTIEDRIHFLDGFSIDLYMVHQPYGFSSPELEMDAMADLVEAGTIRSVGVSNFSAKACVKLTKHCKIVVCLSQQTRFAIACWIVPSKRTASWTLLRSWGSQSLLIPRWLRDC